MFIFQTVWRRKQDRVFFCFLSEKIINQSIADKAIFATPGEEVLTWLVEIDLSYQAHVFRKKLIPESSCMLQILSTKVSRKFVYEQLTQTSWSWLLLCLTRIKRAELWVAFGTRAIFKYIPVHQPVEVIGPKIRSILPVVQANDDRKWHSILIW